MLYLNSRVSFLLITTLLLTACATPHTAQTTKQTNPPAEPTRQAPTPHVIASDNKGSFEPSTLYSLLVAEIASQRGMPQVALHNYLREAETTGDLGIIRHAVHLASQHRDSEALLRAVKVWQLAEPDNPAPYRVSATQLIQRGEAERALPSLEKALRLDDQASIDMLANNAGKLSLADRERYLQLTDQLLTEKPDRSSLSFLQGVLRRAGGDLTAALDSARRALDQDPANDNAIILEAELQADSGHPDTAISHLREALQNRSHKRMQTLYARLLFSVKQYAQGEAQVAALITKHPNDHNLAFFLAVMLLEHDRLESADAYFTDLENRLGSNPAVAYYRGKIASQQEQKDLALEHFIKADNPPYLLPSRAEITRLLDRPDDRSRLVSIFSASRQSFPDRAATLLTLEGGWLAEHGFTEEALARYNEGLTQFPNDSRLRYNRAMLLEQRDDLNGMERDLRHLIETEPNNATALNALGYSLTERTDRHAEAHDLIKRALELKPEDPAILDSMGWVLFNLGKPQQALSYLVSAYQRFPDPEIATHLGKVYWRLGDTERAMKIWREALERTPDSKLLLDALAEVGAAN